MARNITNKSYLTPNQVAELLMVSPAAVRQWSEKGDLKAMTTPGGHRRFLPSEVERFAKQRGTTLNMGHEQALRVLIVDDDQQLARYLVALITGLGVEVLTDMAKDGFEAGLKIREFVPDVVLLDLKVPGIDGFEVCRQLKLGPDTKDIRVLAMTGHISQENVAKILSAGAEVCLSKPINEQLLLQYLGLEEERYG